jgi:hypothetical protein
LNCFRNINAFRMLKNTTILHITVKHTDKHEALFMVAQLRVLFNDKLHRLQLILKLSKNIVTRVRNGHFVGTVNGNYHQSCFKFSGSHPTVIWQLVPQGRALA